MNNLRVATEIWTLNASIARAEEISAAMFVRATELSQELSEDAQRVANAIKEVELREFLTAISSATTRLHGVAQNLPKTMN